MKLYLPRHTLNYAVDRSPIAVVPLTKVIGYIFHLMPFVLQPAPLAVHVDVSHILGLYAIVRHQPQNALRGVKYLVLCHAIVI